MPIFHVKPNLHHHHRRTLPDLSDAEETERALLYQRNERLAQKVQRQIDYETKPPKSDKNGRKSKQEQKPRPSQNEDQQQNKTKRYSKVAPESQLSIASTKGEENAEEMDRIRTSDTESEPSKAAGIDAVVFVAVLAQILGCVAIGLACYAFHRDSIFNGVLDGENPLIDPPGYSVFSGKTLNMKGHFYLEKAHEYATRRTLKELNFILLLIVVVMASVIHIFGFYMRAHDFDDQAAVLIGLYAASGAISIYISTLLLSSAVDVENSYTYAADMLYNFQHAFDGDDPIPDKTKCPADKYVRGCDSYEYSRKVAKDLEMIFRLCGNGSRFTRYYRVRNTEEKPLTILGENYTRLALKSINFCSPDGYKFVAAVFSMIAGILFSIVPVIFCCETKSVKHHSSMSSESSPPKEEPQEKERPKRSSTPVPNYEPSVRDLDEKMVMTSWQQYIEDEEDDKETVSKNRLIDRRHGIHG